MTRRERNLRRLARCYGWQLERTRSYNPHALLLGAPSVGGRRSTRRLPMTNRDEHEDLARFMLRIDGCGASRAG